MCTARFPPLGFKFCEGRDCFCVVLFNVSNTCGLCGVSCVCWFVPFAQQEQGMSSDGGGGVGNWGAASTAQMGCWRGTDAHFYFPKTSNLEIVVSWLEEFLGHNRH